jgi:hypothetical protein
MRRKLVIAVLVLACVGLQVVAVRAATDTTEVTGTVPLVIYDVSSTDITNNSATILWKTSGAASSQVFYDTAFHGNIADYDYHTPEYTAPVTAHSVPLIGLSPSTTYHYRVRSVAVVDSTELTAISDDYTFKTLPGGVPPSVFTLFAWPVGSRSAVVWGWLPNMGGASSVKVYFQWGKTTGYGSNTGQQTMRHPGIFIAVITGLTPRTRYHFRAVAVGNGTSYGRDESFTTWR